MLHGFLSLVVKAISGIAAAIRARPRVFSASAVGVFLLSVFLPPAVLSLTRRPLDYFTFNPWLSKLPEYLVTTEVSIKRKLEFLPELAVFWFSADSPYGGVEWGFAVDVGDLVRILFTSLIFGAYFALWFYRRDQLTQPGWGVGAGRHGGVAGAFVSVLGLSTGPCSVMGCGAPVLPVVGLAFVGLSSGTLKFLADLSGVATAVVLFTMTVGVVYLGWLVGATPRNGRSPRS
jgi:hypothetical protein